MQEFMRKFIQLNGERVKVILEHCLFENQTFYCDKLQTINDEERIGVVLKKREMFVYKCDIVVAEVQGDMYKISDGRLTIKVIINKL